MVTTPLDQLRGMGRFYVLTREDAILANRIGRDQSIASGARGSRGAGADPLLRIWGACGEIAVARLLGIDPQVRALAGPDDAPDITFDGLSIEVKAGYPMVWRRSLRVGRWYVAIHPDTSGRWYVSSIAKGSAILERGEFPPEEWCPRPGTRQLNWRF